MRVQDPRRPPAHPAARWLNRRRTDAFIVSNESQRRSYVSLFGLAPGRVYRIPPGFDTSGWDGGGGGERIRDHCGIGPDTLLVASIARFAPQKDHENFFAAAELVAGACPGVHFLAAGYPAEFDSSRIREMAEGRPALEGRLTLWGEELEDGRELVRSADIGVVHSSSSEAICRVAMEFMADGIPLVATRIGALPEVIDDERSGLLVPAGEPGALAGAISRLLRSEKLRERLGSAGRERLTTVFPYGKAVERLESTLQSIVG